MEPASAEVSAFILAGGKSTRMGMDKAFIALDGRTLLARMLDLARLVSPEVAIVGDAAKFAPFAPTVQDVFPGCGPLGGIHAALRASKSDMNLILAVDVPFVSLALLQYLITRAGNAPDALATVARSGGWQPLCAIYRREFQDAAERALRAGRHKIDALFAEVRMHVIEEQELETAGFAPRIFRNLNTPDDLAQAGK
jgi:molybdopterin-guanine dinucleotide biosynthesis protein A